MVNIKRRLLDKIYAHAEYSGKNETGGLLLGKIRRDGTPQVDKIIILEQKRTHLGFEITDEAMMEFTKTADDKTLKSVIGWWHSHGFALPEWSRDDDMTFKRLAKFMSGFCVGIVVSIDDGRPSRFRVDIQQKGGYYLSINDIQPNIIEPIKKGIISAFLSRKEKAEIDAKVITDPSAEVVWDECPHCQGSGVIFSKRNQIDNDYTLEGGIYGQNKL